MRPLRIRDVKEVPTVCPYCSVGCGLIGHVENGRLINMEGDPDNPISEGSLCSKGSAVFQYVTADTRLKSGLYRAPNSDRFEEKPVEWILDRVAEKIKATRDATFQETVKVEEDVAGPDGKVTRQTREYVVNRTTGLAHIGSAVIDNEECYMIAKLMRSLGVVYLEHHARI